MSSVSSTTTNSATDQPSVPAGKVACLLCGGFISVSGGDRARFIDHMSNEHDAKAECHDVLLAICVLDTKERGFIVKSSTPRLEDIGRGQSPDFSNTFLTKLGTGSAAPLVKPPNSFQPRQPAPQYRRGGQRGLPRQTRPHQVQPPVTPAPPAPAFVPSVLQGNGSISISRVDTTRKCNMCSEIFPNPGALVEHMNRNHFKGLGGINIVSKADNDAQKSEYQERAAQQQSPVQTPSNYLVPKQPQNPRPMVRNSPYQTNQRQIPSNVPRMADNSPRMTNSVRTINNTRSPAPGAAARPRNPEVVKCNVCSKTVEKSKLSVHKLSHAQERKTEKVNKIKTAVKNKPGEIVKIEKKPGTEVPCSEEVELIDLEDETDVNDGDTIARTTNTSINTPLPHQSFRQGDLVSKGDIQCKICDKNLASNMALKMHNNLKHPVKKEVDTEMLLEEEEKDKARESSIKNEIDKLETMELLDNLVNFLNDA
eukprot:GFUD01039301.1.p1 GENE.GFUD01039301.1~~GFUD01039301.1.p1  ORF type:complete len:481 (+),score=119.69 GFUD01039301.1:116-1558(+)